MEFLRFFKAPLAPLFLYPPPPPSPVWMKKGKRGAVWMLTGNCNFFCTQRTTIYIYIVPTRGFKGIHQLQIDTPNLELAITRWGSTESRSVVRYMYEYIAGIVTEKGSVYISISFSLCLSLYLPLSLTTPSLSLSFPVIMNGLQERYFWYARGGERVWGM